MTTRTRRTPLVYRSSNFRLTLDLAEAADEFPTSDEITRIYDEHVRVAETADVLIYDQGEDIVASIVKKRGARIVREYLQPITVAG